MSKIPSQFSGGGVMRPAQAAAFLGIAKSTLYRWLSERRDFPRMIHIGPRCSGWRRADLERWLDAQVEQEGGAA